MIRTLNLRTTIAIIVGGVIGSGIFMKPAIMTLQLGSPMLLIAVWIVAGLITLFGALSNAELAAMFPETGGQYVFFQKIYGNFFAYLYGWAAFSVFNTAGNASIAYVFAQYSDYFLHLPRLSVEVEKGVFFSIPFVGTFFPLENIGVKSLTILLVGLLTYLNYRSVAQSGLLQRVLTALKIIAIALLIIGMAFSRAGSVAHFGESLVTAPSGWTLVSALMAATAGAFWAYDGWNNITFVAGEIIEPQQNIPKSLFLGLTTCIVTYVLVNLSFVYMLPIKTMANSSFVAADAATVAWGTIGGGVISLMVVLSTLGSANANILATARVTFALGRANQRFSIMGKVHPVFQTPSSALVINALWSFLLILSGSFDMLTDMLIFVTWFFYGSSALGLFILRKKMPEQERPYRVWGYPIVPMIFVGFTIFFLVTTLINDIQNYITGASPVINAGLGIFITLIGVVFYRKENFETPINDSSEPTE
jgi:APA family basic amino acid/polyamine antiporter